MPERGTGRNGRRRRTLVVLLACLSLMGCASGATLAIDATDAPTGAMEGEVYVVDVVGVMGRVHHEQFWKPGIEFAVPAGRLTIGLWTQSCAGNCNSLDPPAAVCSVEVQAQPGTRVLVRYASSDWITASCDAVLD